jgi:glutathione synthase/RimK-type ligase-like ATP-grasp enzyme
MRRRLRRTSTVSRAVILPYKIGSQSAKKLANNLISLLGLKVRRVRHDGLYRPKARSLIINYGSNARPAWPVVGKWLNDPSNCASAGNKLRAFEAFKAAGVAIPDFTTDSRVATQWISDGAVVVVRTILNGHSGRGIVLADTAAKLVNAPLYVKYKKKRKEFRVHVFQGKVIDTAEKRKRRVDNPPAFDGYVRNLANGWVFCRDGVVKPADLDGIAVAACTALGLDFGAVDVIWNEHENKCYVLEVNTAPGLEGTTLTNYTNAILGWIKAQV